MRERITAIKTLLPSQKNALLELIKKSNLPPHEFAQRDTTNKANNTLISVIGHNPSHFYCTFEIEPEKIWCSRSPGQHSRAEKELLANWADACLFFSEWLKFLEREVKAPDLWSTLKEGAKLLEKEPKFREANEKFTPEEQEIIIQKLEQIRHYLTTTYPTTEENLKAINQKIDLLIEETRAQKKETWKHTAIGVFASIITTLSLSPEQGQAIWLFILNHFSQITHQIEATLK